MSTEKQVEELTEAARKAGAIITDQVDAIVEAAQRRADQILLDAELGAQHKQQAALAAAHMLLERIMVLEGRLGELVVSIREEIERTTDGLNGDPGEVTPMAMPARRDSTTERDDAIPAEPEESLEEPPATDTSDPEAEIDGDGTAEADPATSELAPEARSGRRGRLRLRGPDKGPFISREGHCAVCREPFMAGSAENLRLSEWRVAGTVGLCPACQAEDWELSGPGGASVRRGGNRG